MSFFSFFSFFKKSLKKETLAQPIVKEPLRSTVSPPPIAKAPPAPPPAPTARPPSPAPSIAKAPPAPPPAPAARAPSPISAGVVPNPPLTTTVSKFSKSSVAALNQYNDGLDDFDDSYGTASILEVDVGREEDPLQGDLEQVAILFANGEDEAVFQLLEGFVHDYPGEEGLPFWRMLFDFFQVKEDRDGFESLALRYAHYHESSPPTWRESGGKIQQNAPISEEDRSILLFGVITEDAPDVTLQIIADLQSGKSLQLDFSKLGGCDDVVAGRLASLLQESRLKKKKLQVVQVSGFLARLNKRMVTGTAMHEPAWRLLLELLQRVGTQENFENRALDYTATFEESPPSWDEAGRQENTVIGGASELTPLTSSIGVSVNTTKEDVFALSGNFQNSRFPGLLEKLLVMPVPNIDFSEVSRMDFYSAGQLANCLSSLVDRNKFVTLLHPNRFVSELFKVVNIDKLARVILPKY